LDLAPFRDAYPTTLSLGMARRAAIARAFAIEPELVLLDEPFVSLDPAMAARSRELLLAAWRARPTAALLVTHDRTEAALLADRVLLLAERPTRVLREVVVPEALRRAAAPSSVLMAALAPDGGDIGGEQRAAGLG
jgi:NitT/TauT family transport system ATP-binding protein